MRNSMTQNQILEQIDEELAQRDLVIKMFNKENYQVFAQNIIMQTSRLSQYMVGFFAILEGYECDDKGWVTDPRNQHARPISLRQLLPQLEEYIPKKYSKLLMSIRAIKNKASHSISFSFEDYVDYLNALDSFSLWFVTNKIVLRVASEDLRRSFFKRSVATSERIVLETDAGKIILDNLGSGLSLQSEKTELDFPKEKKDIPTFSYTQTKKANDKSKKSASKVAKKAPSGAKKQIVAKSKSQKIEKSKSQKAEKSKSKSSLNKREVYEEYRGNDIELFNPKPYEPEPTQTNHEKDTFEDFVRDEKFVNTVISAGDMISEAILEKLLPRFERIEANQRMISNQIGDLSKQIASLGEKLVDYQTLMKRQLNMVSSDEAKEQILSAFTDVLIDKIKSEIITQYDRREYNNEADTLKESFGDTWEKLQPSTRKFLVSSKLLYRHQILLGDQTDYSGVCVLITKSLEVELSKRFYADFMKYLTEHYDRQEASNSERYLDFPTFMIKRKRPLQAKDFSLGSVAYFFCYKRGDKLTEDQWNKNKRRLVEYCKSE